MVGSLASPRSFAFAALPLHCTALISTLNIPCLFRSILSSIEIIGPIDPTTVPSNAGVEFDLRDHPLSQFDVPGMFFGLVCSLLLARSPVILDQGCAKIVRQYWLAIEYLHGSTAQLITSLKVS